MKEYMQRKKPAHILKVIVEIVSDFTIFKIFLGIIVKKVS